MSELNDMTIHVLGRLDCPRVTHLKALIEDLSHNVAKMPKFDFQLEFETQFDLEKEKLLKEDLAFLKYEKCPLLYTTTANDPKKKIIGSLEEFQNYCIENLNYHDRRKTEDFVEQTINNLKEFFLTNGLKYVYFDFQFEKAEGEEPAKEDKLDRVIIELFNTQCPITSKNFLEICKGTTNDKGEKLSYENTIIHRVSPSSFIQGGDIRVSGSRCIYGKCFNDERYDIKHNTHGILGMVKKGMNSHTNECQFYITLAPLNCFDGKFVAFGRVIQGYETIRKIGITKTDLQRPINRVIITKCGEYEAGCIKVNN